MSIRILSVTLAFLAACGVSLAASAAEVRTRQLSGDAPKSSVTVSVFEPVTSYNMTPAFGGTTLGVLPNNRLPAGPATGILTPVPYSDFMATYKAGVMGGQLGVFGGYNSVANLFESAPTTGWNFGASVGYAGFYFRAGVSSDAAQAAAQIVNETNRGWLAGLGYEFGAFDLRLTYMAAEPIGFTDRDVVSKLWMIGGIYQLTPRVRVNADAFTGGRDLRNTTTVLTAPANAAAPQGTGARVGIQLKF